MSKAFLFIFVLSGSLQALAGAVQVPENCANRVTPCLVRTEQGSFQFVHGNVQVKMEPDSLVKITAVPEQVNFEIMAGYAALTDINPSKTGFALNNVPVDSAKVLGSRDGDALRILSLTDFSYAHFKISEENFPVRVSANFINKKDLVYFTQHFFTDTKEYRLFLTKIEKDWSTEFKRQNISQTKALARSVASQQQQEKELSDKMLREKQQLKRVRENFFNRTFYR